MCICIRKKKVELVSEQGVLDLILQAVKNSAVKAFLCECEFAALGVSSQGLTGSSCSSSFEDREKAFLSTVDLFEGVGAGPLL